MKTIFKSYKFKISPTKTQEDLLNRHFGACRFVFNHYLNARKEAYLANKKFVSYYDNAEDLTKIKGEEQFKWMKEINSQSLQSSLRNLDTAYNKFFRKQAKFPRFKSKHNKQSFTIPQNILIKNNKLFVSKFREGIKINGFKEIQGKILFATVSKTVSGLYFVSLTCEVNHEPYSKTGSVVGIDTGIKTLATLSNGKTYENVKYLKTKLKKLKFNQRLLSKKIKGSSSRQKQKEKLARIHEKITNVRKDHLHKVSTEIIKNHDVVCVEDLSVKSMMKNHVLAQALSDVALGTFYSMLEYKAEWNDRKFVKIDRFFPSSKMCSGCNFIKQDLTLNDRTWTCSQCGVKHDRDLNASINILNQGKKILEAGNALEAFPLESCGSGIESQDKQKQAEALLSNKSMKPDFRAR